jgi:4-oxalocrotonate tautomerase
MPHIIVTLYPGRTEEQKHHLAREILKDVVTIAGCEEKSVSVAFEEVSPEEWAEKVYQPEIVGRQELLVIEPGYTV